MMILMKLDIVFKLLNFNYLIKCLIITIAVMTKEACKKMNKFGIAIKNVNAFPA